MRLGDGNFFNLFSRLVTATNPDRDRDEWQAGAVRWRRRRHVEWSTLSFQIETHELEHAVRPRWRLVFVHEIWWGIDRGKAIRNAHWVHLAQGDRRDVLKWFQARQAEIDA
ncbi:MAG TPA: hypothetical protein VMH86_12470 [Rhizomicrobium sp.]|nr:hypothetical protein [Rhizomicrobium sp.]